MTRPATAVSSLLQASTVLMLAFKVLMGINGLGVGLILALVLDLFPATLPSYWLRLPLAMFLAGMMLSLLGLFWSGMLVTARRPGVLERPARMRWLPVLFAMLSYFLAILMFAAACWAFLGVASLSQYHDDPHFGLRLEPFRYFQHP